MDETPGPEGDFWRGCLSAFLIELIALILIVLLLRACL